MTVVSISPFLLLLFSVSLKLGFPLPPFSPNSFLLPKTLKPNPQCNFHNLQQNQTFPGCWQPPMPAASPSPFNQHIMIHYACIAKSTTTLAHHRPSSSADDPNIQSLASQCIANSPPNHSFFSHTLHRRTYAFLTDPPFLFFAIFDHHLPKPRQLAFLHRLSSGSRPFLHSAAADDDDRLAPFCFQSQFDPIFRDTFDSELGSKDAVSRNPSSSGDDSTKGKGSSSSSATVPLLTKPAEGLLKKKKRAVDSNGGIDGKEGGGGAAEKKVDVCGGDEGSCGVRDFSVAVAGKGVASDRHQKAKHIWKKHVWVVLTLDLFVCVVLFLIWLWVCSGFKCMAY